jgi:polysaccharide export outer membrane protein
MNGGQIVTTSILLLALSLLTTGRAVSAETLAGYQIQPGDVLGISVWREEELTKGVLVRPDGAISFPLVGDLVVYGKTPEQVGKELAIKLKPYIPDPVLTVSVNEISGNQIFVIGKVARPGQFPATRYMDVMQALSVAGGTTTYAELNKIKILRRENGALKAMTFKYGEVEKGKNLDQNVILKAGDVVVVP